MSFADLYLSKQQNFQSKISHQPKANTGLVITIPAYIEPDITSTLASIIQCTPPSSVATAVLIHINHPENADAATKEKSLKSFTDTQKWISENTHSDISFHVSATELPSKHAGVGLARKTLMDEATWLLNQINQPKGLIVCLDADSTVSKNYLTELEHFQANQLEYSACNLYFEHPICGSDYDSNIYTAITLYELYLRYLVEYLRYINFAYPYHTVGSSLAVRAETYANQGGMNKRQAGEDFYFIQKLIEVGRFTELNNLTVYPSPRQSNRVPFGTGMSIIKMIESGVEYLTYNPKSFDDLHYLYNNINGFYNGDIHQDGFSDFFWSYLSNNNFKEMLQEIQKNSSDLKSFTKRFYRKFNTFFIIKYLNFAHLNHYQKIKIEDAAIKLLTNLEIAPNSNRAEDLLQTYRALHKQKEEVI